MLNQETKRRIDSARDILVGKVPDPKAQVEQITTALIYKFMDDMDKESEELGGKARFFVNEYEKYAWSKLLDPRLGGYDRLNLYSEALLKMPQNPNLPQLFRNILKDAFLPYRDPETLNLFLKEINDFTYEHSEKLGDAYEYLLSVLGSQGDAGQFRTPRHIIDFIVEVVDPKKDDTVLDPACGTAGFLISAYKHILRQNTIHGLGDQLTPEEKTKLMQHFVGYDISPDMVKLSLVNMYLHSFPNPNVFEYDTLTNEERWDETFDVIMANPPFMSPKGGIRPHKRFSIQANRSEVLFVDYISEHLTTHGRAGVIVPEGIIFQSGNAYKALRKMLIEKYLFAVVSLPAGVFQPYSGVKTSILLMDKQLAKKADSILFVKVENDGFDLGAQRRAIEKNDLTEALCILQKYKQALQENRDVRDLLSDGEEPNLATIVEKKKIAKNGDYNLSGERYKETLVRLHHQWSMVELEDLCKIQNGFAFKSSDYVDSGLRVIRISNVQRGDIIDNYPEFINSERQNEFKEYLLEKDDILISLTGNVGRVGMIKSELLPALLNQRVGKINVISSRAINEYIFWILNNDIFENHALFASSGIAQANLSSKWLEKYKIPLPPLEVQQEIVAELESYQKIIDGAKQVVENYLPTIRIEPGWEIKTLGEVCDRITDGTHQTPTYAKSGVIFLSSKNVTSKKIDWDNVKYIPENLHIQLSKRVSPKLGDVLLAKSGTTGVAALVDKDIVFDIYESLALFRVNDYLLPEYLLQLLNSQFVENQFQSRIKGISIKHLHLDELRLVQIPVPPLDIQRQIVNQIEQEQKLVDANKRLIEIFEQKIKDKISEVWGEELHKEQGQNASSNGITKQPKPVQQVEALQGELRLSTG